MTKPALILCLLLLLCGCSHMPTFRQNTELNWQDLRPNETIVNNYETVQPTRKVKH